MIQGAGEVYDEARAAVYLEGRSPKREEWEPFAPYQEKYDRAWWKSLPRKAPASGHCGAGHIELGPFVRPVRARAAPPIGVYDSAAMSAIIPLSEQSIAQSSTPVEVPDFTRGRWQAAKPRLAVAG